MKRKWLNVTIGACIWGIICSFISLHNYYRIFSTGTVSETSFCSISDFINCDVVEASTYSSFMGFPVAGFGISYYVLILLLSLFAKFSRGFKKPAVAFAWWTTLPAILYSIVLAYISLFVLETVCLTCVGMYIANILLFISLFLTMSMPLSETWQFIWGYWATTFTGKKRGIDFKTKFGSYLLVSIIVFVTGFVVVSSVGGKTRELTDKEIKNHVSQYYLQSKYIINVAKEELPMWGTKGAPVTIIEFSDYRCPFCKIAAFTIKPFLTQYKKYIAYYFVNYPLDSSCNHYMKHQMHPGACLGAKAGICADKQGEFWPFHDELFRSSGRITKDLVVKIAGDLDLDKKQFIRCIESAETERRLKSDIEASRRIHITGTPTIFINNRKILAWKNPEVLRAIVRKEIGREAGSGNITTK